MVRWFARHPRYHLHFTPSWLNQVERFFAKITTQRIRRGTFENVRALKTAIESYLTHHNEHGKPFVWTVTADAILGKVVAVEWPTRHGESFEQNAICGP